MDKKSRLLITSLILLSTLTGCEKNLTADEAIAAAKTSIAEKKPNDAIIYLKNALQQNISNAEARYLLGQVYLSKGQWLNAEKELNKAVELGYSAPEIWLGLAKVQYYLSDLQGLKELSESNVVEANQAAIDYYYAIGQIQQGNAEDGIALLKQVVADGADSKYTRLSRIWLESIEQNNQVASEQLDQLLLEKPNFSDALSFKGYFYYQQGDMAKSVDAFKAFLLLHPSAHQIHFMYTSALANDGQFEEAEKNADQLLKISSENALLNQIKAQAMFAKKNYREAKNHAEVALRGNDSLIIAKIIAGVSSYQLNELEAAYSYLVAVENYLSYKHPAKRLLSAIKLQLGNFDEQYADLMAAEAEDIDADLLTVSAQEYFRLGDKTRAEQLLNKAVSIAPNNDGLTIQQGILKLLNNDSAAADYLKRALEINPELDPASTLLVLELIRQKEYQQAMAVANKLKASNGTLANTLIGSVHKAQEQYPQAQKYYLEAVELDANNIAALYNLGWLAEREADLQTALNYYQKVIEINPNHLKALSGILGLSTNNVFKERILTFLLKQQAEYPKNDALTVTLAEYYWLNSKFDEAKSLLAKNDNSVRVLDQQARLFVVLQDYQQALISLNKALNLEPNNVSLLLSKADVLEKQNKRPAAIDTLTKVSSPNVAVYARLIELYLDENKLSEAKRVLAKLESYAPNHIATLRFKGKVAFIERDYPLAVELLTQVNQEQKSKPVVLELVQSLQNIGREQEAIAIIRELENGDTSRLPFALQAKLAELYTDVEKLDDAIVIYQDLAEETQGDFVVLNNLAWTYYLQGNYQEAEKIAQAALAKMPASAAVQNTLGQILLANKKSLQALSLLKEAYSVDVGNDAYGLNYLEALIATDKKQEARVLLLEMEKKDLSSLLKNRLSNLKSKL